MEEELSRKKKDARQQTLEVNTDPGSNNVEIVGVA